MAIPCIADNLVQNPGFETGDLTSWAQVGDDWVPAWNYVGGNSPYDLVSPHGGAKQLLDGNTSSAGLAGVSQTITDISGANYDFSFWLAQTATNAPGDQAYVVKWNDTVLLSEDGASQPDAWTQFDYTVVGTGSDTISFEGYSNSGYNDLDDVSVVGAVSAVPDTTTAMELWTMLIAIGVLHTGLRRLRSRKQRS